VVPVTRRHNGEGSIYPNRNGFAAYAWITTLAGRRQRKYVYGKTREVVHTKWVQLTREAARGPVVTKVPTVGQFLQRWLDETVAPNLAPLTHATYESHVRHYIEPALGGVRLDRLRVSDVQSWLNGLPAICQCCAQGKDARRADGMARCCAAGRCCHSNPSPRTVKDVRAVLRSALSAAMRDELVERNVAELVTTPKQRKRKVVPWTSEEARRFLESARSDAHGLYAAYVLVLVLGMRKGEVLGLRWGAVDFDHRELIVDHQLQRVRRQLLYRETKTEASDDSLPLPDIACTALRLRSSQQESARERAREAWRVFEDPQGEPVDLVFTGRYGTPIDPRTFNRVFTARCDLAEVRRLTVHDARRTCATLLVDLDVHPRVIMRILRHADQGVTMKIYAKASSDKTREALRRLGDSLD
jgi:integrase